MAHACWLGQHGGGFDHVLAGRTAITAWRNVGETLVGFLRGFGCHVKANMGRGFLLLDTPSGRCRLWIVGANDNQSRAKIQGSTFQSAHVDEAPLLNKDFWYVLWSRLSTEPARLLATLNPEAPAHWYKREIIDQADAFDAEVMDFSFADNPVLSAAARKRIEAGYSGHWYQRMVLGQWAGASGLVLPRWSTCTPSEVPAAPVWTVGLDWGAASTSAAVLLASERIEAQRWAWRSVVVSEWRHDARQDGTLTDAETVEKVDRWMQAATGNAERRRVSVYVDPSTHAGFKALLRRRGYTVLDANNEVLPGLATTDARLSAGNVRFLVGACRHLEAELASYGWDQQAADRGEDRPVKQADHLADALRYAVHTGAYLSRRDAWRERRAKVVGSR